MLPGISPVALADKNRAQGSFMREIKVSEVMNMTSAQKLLAMTNLRVPGSGLFHVFRRENQK